MVIILSMGGQLGQGFVTATHSCRNRSQSKTIFDLSETETYAYFYLLVHANSCWMIQVKPSLQIFRFSPLTINLLNHMVIC
jgi:hypothetical protein